MRHVKIDLDEKGTHYLIDIPFDMNWLIKSMPSRRFYKKVKVWKAPIVRKNSEFIRDNFLTQSHGRLVISDDALAAVDKSVNSNKELAKTRPIPPNYVFKTDPMTHQVSCLQQHYGQLGNAIFAEMGSGKTKIAIDMSCMYKLEGLIKSTVVLCPYAIRHNWTKELKIHAPDADGYLVGIVDTNNMKAMNRMIREFFSEKHADQHKILIVGIQSLQPKELAGNAYMLCKEFAILAQRHGGFNMVVDESHRIKNHAANTTKNAIDIGELAVFRTIMTGSPIAVGLTDLYAQYTFAHKEILGVDDFMAFKTRYCVYGGYENKQVVGYTNVDELMDTVKPYTFYCKKEDVMDLPDKTYTIRECKMTKDQRKVYDQILDEGMVQLEDMEDADMVYDAILAKMVAAQQVMAGYLVWHEIDEETEKRKRFVKELVPPEKNPKYMDLMEKLEQLKPTDKAIIWCRFRQEILDVEKLLKAKFGDCSVVTYYGDTSEEDRQANVNDFGDDPDVRWFVSNQQTGGTGLTLNAAWYTEYVSNSYNLIDRLQSEDRNHRIGQEHNVLYTDYAYEKSVDQSVALSLQSKKGLADMVRDKLSEGQSGGSVLKELFQGIV